MGDNFMEHFNNEEREIIEKAQKMFKYRKISEYTIVGVLISAFIIGLILNNFVGSEAGKYFIIIISMVAGFTVFVLNVYFWKCPKCKLSFPMNFSSTRYMSHCPYCGVKLK